MSLPLPQPDADVISELAWGSPGEIWEGADDPKWNGYTIVAAKLLDTSRWFTHHETIFTHVSFPGRFFRIPWRRDATENGDNEYDDIVEVYPHSVTTIEYRKE
ncbi:hypothetical protein [Bradyrhizobium sp. SZCCHNRI2049]|uniref:hypothetical protein n=1 Tax=Bradyrhizobium sp. SZCCHNRI2049 TaxID=3057287 RepID=UPI002915EF88|nr:hypothetical protein [Bradyrhizobium sp. SZCCHNRI2049]